MHRSSLPIVLAFATTLCAGCSGSTAASIAPGDDAAATGGRRSPGSGGAAAGGQGGLEAAGNAHLRYMEPGEVDGCEVDPGRVLTGGPAGTVEWVTVAVRPAGEQNVDRPLRPLLLPRPKR